MALVDYSGSESSDEGGEPVVKQITKSKTLVNKPAFQKVVDRSDPHKIRVNLPEATKPIPVDDESNRPSKRAKIGSEGMGGFNALLPAPKRVAAPNGGVSLGGPKKGGLGSGVNLRTGATPGFSREPESEPEHVAPPLGDGHVEEVGTIAGSGTQTGAPDRPNGESAFSTISQEKLIEDDKPTAKVTMFKPLSVARKPQKKKPPQQPTASANSGLTSMSQAKPIPRISLFSTETIEESSRNDTEKRRTYEPMVYHSSQIDPTPPLETPESIETEETSNPHPPTNTSSPHLQSLDTIAADLNLSKSAKRQLLGRQKVNASAVNIVNFNIDEEYQANEDIRKSGEQVQHNAVRSIAPGKHSLKQLVNMGTAQADALEESFASGRRNRSEAGSKYGW